MMEPKRLEDDVIIAPGGMQKFAKYHKDKNTGTRKTSNKSTMCSVLLGQCAPAMHAMLEMTKDWDSNKSDLLFDLKAAEAAYIGVQKNFSPRMLAREALRTFANCFQNSEEPFTYKQTFISCVHKLEKAGIGYKFGKKFLDLEKAKNSNLADDAEATKTANNRFYKTTQLMNSSVDESVTNNLVQDYCTGAKKYLASVDKAFALVRACNQGAPGVRRTTISLLHRHKASRREANGDRGRGTGHGGTRPSGGAGGAGHGNN